MMGPVAAGKQVIQIFQQVKAVADKMEAEFAQSEQTAAILNSTLKATGNAAGLTAEDIQDLAAEFQATTKFEGDMVIGMENVLLGFKNIKGDNFKEASLQILNMATVMNMDLTSAAQAVGKALDDPIRGIDSLSRQGFKFSDDQKAVLKALVETGHTAEAQKIILDELATTYGGAAVAAGDTASALKTKLSNAIGDINEEIGRSISNNLAPWREKWLQIAISIGASVKAQNDFNDAMKRMSEGTNTQADSLLVAENYLQVLKDTAKTAKGGGAAISEMYGDEVTIGAQIKAQEELIKSIKEQVRINALYQGRSDAIAEREKEKAAQYVKDQDAKAEAARKATEQAILDAEAAEKAFEEWGDDVLTTWGLLGNLGEPLVEIKEVAKDIGNEVDQVSSAWSEWTVQIGDTEMSLANLKESGSMVWDSVSSAYQSYLDLQENGSDAIIAGLERQRDQMKKNGEDTTAIDKDINAKKNAAAEKQFNANKATSLADIAINTAVAISKTMANPWLAAAVASLGIVQAGTVAAQQYVPFASGGYVDQPTHALIGEAGGEWILNKAQMSGLVKSGIGGGGVTIVQNIGGSVWTSKGLESLAVSAVAKAGRGF